jgi:methyltransferase OMS1
MSKEEQSRFACLEVNAANLSQFPNGCFDTVVNIFGLCSYDDPVQVLQEMARVCKPDGKILLLEHRQSKTWHGPLTSMQNDMPRTGDACGIETWMLF